MSELIELAFLFCSRAKERGLNKYDILWLAEQQLERLDTIEFSKYLDELILGKGGGGYELGRRSRYRR
jgi:hypothetical protein